MNRNLLSSQNIEAKALESMLRFHPGIVAQVKTAIDSSAVVVVGMAQNPMVKRARRALEQAGQPFTYLEYGSYLTQWKKRLAIKLWSGWPTFPQVFVQGRLIGGCVDVEKALQSGEWQTLLAHPRQPV